MRRPFCVALFFYLLSAYFSSSMSILELDFLFAGFTSVRKTVDATEAQFEQLAATSKKMSTEVAAGKDEINEVMASGGQLGVATEHLRLHPRHDRPGQFLRRPERRRCRDDHRPICQHAFHPRVLCAGGEPVRERELQVAHPQGFRRGEDDESGAALRLSQRKRENRDRPGRGGGSSAGVRRLSQRNRHANDCVDAPA